MMAIGIGQSMVAPMIAGFGMTGTVKVLDFYSISLSIGVTTYQNGYAISIKIPGFSQVLGWMLDVQAQSQK